MDAVVVDDGAVLKGHTHGHTTQADKRWSRHTNEFTDTKK